MNVSWNGATVSSRQFVKYFHVAVLQKDINMRAVILLVCIVPLKTENILQSFSSLWLPFTAGYLSMAVFLLVLDTGTEVYGKPRYCCTEAIRGLVWDQNIKDTDESKAFGQPVFGCCLLPPRQAPISFPSCNKTSAHLHTSTPASLPRTSAAYAFRLGNVTWSLGFEVAAELAQGVAKSQCAAEATTASQPVSHGCLLAALPNSIWSLAAGATAGRQLCAAS